MKYERARFANPNAKVLYGIIAAAFTVISALFATLKPPDGPQPGWLVAIFWAASAVSAYLCIRIALSRVEARADGSLIIKGFLRTQRETVQNVSKLQMPSSNAGAIPMLCMKDGRQIRLSAFARTKNRLLGVDEQATSVAKEFCTVVGIPFEESRSRNRVIDFG